MSTTKKIKILAIAGVGRSGSTVLEKTLGHHKDLFPIGEFAMLWGEMKHDFLCDCNQSFFKCPFWNEVFGKATGGFNGIDAEEILKTRQAVDRNYFIPLIENSYLRPKSYDSKLKYLVEVLSKIYSAIREVSNCEIILDSSKSPAYFHILSLIPEVELTIIHLVRDSRAVAYSWQKKKRMTYSIDREQYIERQGAVEASVKWNAKNLVTHTLKPIANQYIVVRYEDFASDPQETVKGILSSLGKKTEDLESLFDREADLSDTHGILGNPTPRSQSQKIEIRKDVEWKTKLKWWDKLIVVSLTWPLLLKYGYLSKLTKQ